MKRLFAVSGSLITLLLFVVVGFLLIRLLQSQPAQNTVQKPDATSISLASSASTQTLTSTLTWETATLNQIQFGEPKAVFTHNDNIKIYDWLPDNQRLLLAIADPEKTEAEELVDRNRLVTLDVQTGEIVEYGRYPNEYRPVWLEDVQGVAYPFLDVFGGGSPEIRLALGDGRVEIIANVTGRLNIDPDTASLFYVVGGTTKDTLRRYDPGRNKSETFSLKDNLPWGYLYIAPVGRWMATFRGGIGYSPMYLVDREKGTVNEVDFDDWWPIDAAWSPDGDSMALVLGAGDMLLSKSQLAIFEPETMEWHFIDLPAGFVTGIVWGPERYLLVKGTPPDASMAAEHKYWLVDTVTEKFKEIHDFTPTWIVDNTFWAWSDSGDVAWLDGNRVMITQITIAEEQ